MPKAKPIQIKSIHSTCDKNKESISKIEELLGIAIYEYAKKHKLL